MKKIISFLIVAVMVLQLSGTNQLTYAASYTFDEEANVLNALGVFDGKSTTSFDPALGDYLTRQESMKLLSDVFSWIVDTSSNSGFPDVDSWADGYVATAANRGVSKGIGSGKFGGRDQVNYYQFYTWILRELGVEDIYDGNANTWKNNIDYYGQMYGILLSDVTDYNRAISRDHAVGVFYKTLGLVSKNNTKSVYELIRLRNPGRVVSDTVADTFSNEVSVVLVPSMGALKEGFVTVNASDSQNMTLILANVSGSVSSVTLDLCYDNVCIQKYASVVRTMGNEISVKIDAPLESGKSYSVSGVTVKTYSGDSYRVTGLPVYDFVVVADGSSQPVEEAVKEATNVTFVASGAVMEVTSRTSLDQYINQTDYPVVVKFSADWCYWCKKLRPTYDGAAAILKNEVILIVVDTDEIDISGFSVAGLPTVQLYNKGSLVDTYVGYESFTDAEYAEKIRSAFGQ